tara:strand:+ start:43 stop:444 length:402 start_codon:yes stop_codon:yes gene_type:complete
MTTKEIYDNILEEIVESVKDIFGNVSPRDEKIIRDNYTIKDSSWNQLGSGMKNVVNMITPLTFTKYENDLIKSLQDTLPQTTDLAEQAIFDALEPQLKDGTKTISWEEMNKGSKEYVSMSNVNKEIAKEWKKK